MSEAAEALVELATALRNAAAKPMSTRANWLWRDGVLDGLTLAAECAEEMARVRDGLVTIEAARDAVIARTTVLTPKRGD